MPVSHAKRDCSGDCTDLNSLPESPEPLSVNLICIFGESFATSQVEGIAGNKDQDNFECVFTLKFGEWLNALFVWIVQDWITYMLEP